MKKFLKSLLKHIIYMIILISITLVICFATSHFRDHKFSSIKMFIGMAYMLIGLLSACGNLTFRGNFKFQQSRSADFRSLNDTIREDFQFQDKSLNFMAFMSISGFIICMI
ncbi:hypothetical protein OW763_04060 [Clostridium aestuarii]|uniref:DUF3899 domain-containing protein n=1 Tax=Clostridium aestuarii TaxID=338193 RepID=A0ABT4D0G1_9CLOT|nr:hypothetical protein [Clostridium aestuarii]MCY6483533.1 hypothetical protein [Clostridium aestuarii]